MEFRKLFEPTRIGKVPIKNRIAMAPMGILGLVNPDGTLTQSAIDYYVERAKGGVGLIITSLFKVENEIEKLIFPFPLVTDAASPSFGELAESVHHYGSKIFIQLTAGLGRVGNPIVMEGQPVSASAIPNYWEPKLTTRELRTDEVEKIVKAFGRAAEIVVAAGINGIELHGHEGYIFDQFTTAIWNKRKDKYGGDLKGRLTFPIEVIGEIKGRVGKNFPVQYRFGLKHYIKGLRAGALPGEKYAEAGRDVEEGLEMVKLLEKAGVDALHVDAGCYDSWYWAHPPTYQKHGCMVDMAAKVKKVAKVPVIAVGRLDVPELAEKVVAEGKADIVAIGRALLADSYWPIKVQEGRVEDIRPCLGCHDGCLGRIVQGEPLCCAVNPSTGREKLYELKPAEKPKKVLVAGGGVAGMEAARALAVKGHKVILYEKEGNLGGHLIEASVPEFKKDLERMLNWYETQLEKARVDIKLRTEVTPKLIEKEKSDVVIVATGSKPILPDVPGVESPKVATCIDLLLNKKRAGDTVVVAGGGLVGCEVALWLVKQGKKVTIVETLPRVLATVVCHANRVMLLDMLALNNVDVITNASIQEITDEGVTITDKNFKRRTIRCDTVALALGLKSDKELYNSLKGKVTQLYAIGDCKEPGKIMDAIWDSYDVTLAL